MAPHIFAGQEDPAAAKPHVGGVVVGVLCLVVLLCLLCFFCLRRLKAKRRIAGQRSVSIRARHVGRPVMAETSPLSSSAPPAFSRRALTASIIMPDKTIIPKPSSPGSSDKADSVPKSPSSPSSPSPPPSHLRSPSNTVSRPPRPRTLSILNPASPRHSRASSGLSAGTQYPFSSGSSSRPSSTISASLTRPRPVRQLFDAVHSDELSLVRYGEHLTVLRSFDDGWCLVARDTSHSPRTSRASRVSVWMANNGDNVDIGVVPAWVFVKPLKGITVSRPFRNESVNALQFDQNPAPTYARDAVVSWSNFG